MGRYFNDDMTEDQNDDYDAYLEHFGIPKDKWDPQVRAKYDQLHHKTKDAYKSISDGAKKFGSKASKRITGAGQNIKNRFKKKTTYTTPDGKKIRGIYTPSGFITIEKPKKKER